MNDLPKGLIKLPSDYMLTDWILYYPFSLPKIEIVELFLYPATYEESYSTRPSIGCERTSTFFVENP